MRDHCFVADDNTQVVSRECLLLGCPNEALDCPEFGLGMHLALHLECDQFGTMKNYRKLF